MTIFFSPFKMSHKYPGQKYSVAVFQPTGYSYPQLTFLAPIDSHGERIRFELFPKEPLIGFEKALRQAYQSRWKVIEDWLYQLSPEQDIVLCCWCPYSETSKNQIKEHGNFACHSGLLAKMIEKYREDLKIVMNEKYHNLYPLWQPKREEHISFEDIQF